MIVHCPSCATRYRQAPDAAGALALGRCSRCATLVPLVAARRAYVLGPRLASAAGPAAEVALAPAAFAVPRAAAAPVSTASFVAASAPRTIAALAPPPEPAPVEIHAAEPEVLALARETPARAQHEPLEATAHPAPHELPRARPRSPRPIARPRMAALREALVVAVPTLLGLGSAYYGSLRQQLDAPTVIAAGTGLGLLVGWIGLRWTRLRP